MAAPTNTFQTYQALGNREDLIDLIINISPTKTPVLSMTESVRAMATLHEWQTDSLNAPTANAAVEGFDSTAAAVTATARVANYCQILTKNFVISGTQEIVRKAGRASEIGYQVQKLTKELATDIEYALVINSATAAGASGTARQLEGLAGWITTNVNSGSSTATRALIASGSYGLDALLATVWAAGGDPDVILVGGNQKIAIAGFTQNTRYISAEATKVVNAVDIYQSSFGTLKTVLSHVMNTSLANSLFALDMSYWRKAWLRPVQLAELSRSGDARKFQLVAELTLESLNQAASGVMKYLT
jgi:hypothetical protein